MVSAGWNAEGGFRGKAALGLPGPCARTPLCPCVISFNPQHPVEVGTAHAGKAEDQSG